MLGYTVHAILSALARTLEVGSIDYCIPLLSDILLTDFFGKADEERGVKAIRVKMKETRTSKAKPCYQLLARIIDFSVRWLTSGRGEGALLLS